MNRLRKYSQFVAVGLLILVVCVQVPAQSINATANRTEVQVAEPFSLSIAVTAPADSSVQFPEATSSLGDFQVLSTRDLFDVPTTSGRTWTRTYELETYESGNLQIPTQTVFVDRQPFRSDPISISVKSIVEPQSDPRQFRALKDVEEIPIETSNGWTIAGIGIGALALAGLVWAVFGRPKSQISASPEQWARTALGDLRESPVYASKDQSEVLPGLANILREYIQRRFAISAPRLTTIEFLQAARNDQRLSDESRVELKCFLEHVDKIKFGKLVPETDQIQESFARVESFIELATPGTQGGKTA